jgi:hypothetical protein
MKIKVTFVMLLTSCFLISQVPPKTLSRILKSGNGQSIQTAFQVHSIDEEYEVLTFLKLNPKSQKSLIDNGELYDCFTLDSKKTVYFKIKPRVKATILKTATL